MLGDYLIESFPRGFEINETTLPIVEEIGKHMPGGFFIYKAEAPEELLYANKACFDIFGCENLEEFKKLTGYTFKGMLFPQDYEAVSKSIIEQIDVSKDSMDHVVYRITRKDGQIRWVDDYGHYTDTELYGGVYFVFISDITERRAEHKALEDAQRMNRQLSEQVASMTQLANLLDSVTSMLSNLPAMSFSKDAKTRVYLACNQAFAEYAGKTKPEEVVGLTDHELFDKETADHFVEDDTKALAMNEAYTFFEDVPDAAGANFRNLQTTKTKYYETSGRLCLLGLCVDVTELTRLKTEQAIANARQQELEQRLALQSRLLEQEKQRKEQDAMITAMASDYRSVYHVDIDKDDAVCYRADPQDTWQMPVGVHFPFRERIRQYGELYVDAKYREGFLRFVEPRNIRGALAAEDIIAYRYLVRRDGLEYYEMLRMAGVRHPADREDHIVHAIGVGFTVIDAEMRQAMQRAHELKEALEAAKQASEAKSTFLSNMSHEIRTPINAILGMNEMIRHESSNPQSVIEYSENIHTAGSALLALVNDIFDFSRIDTGKMEIVSASYDLSSLINDLAGMVQAKTEEKGLQLKLDFDETMPKLLHGDAERIRQVAMNLLSNAIKYTQKGSITFHISYERIPDDPEGVFLDFSVIDTGIGIKPEDMDKLFTEFERIEEKRNRNIAGLGLGLSITKSLLEMMGSELKVESVYGQGSTFSFRLRQKVDGWEALGHYEATGCAPLPEQTKSRKTFIAPAASVLVVDDTPMNLTVFMGLLKSTKMQIDTAESGDEGLKLMKDKKYDLIVLDHMMPEKDGIETLHELRADANNPNLHTPVICLTANAITGAREMYLAEGFDEYLTKPIEGEDLKAAIIEHLPPEKVMIQNAPEEGEGETAEEMTELRTFYASVPELNYGDAIRFCANEEVLKGTLEQFYRAINPNINAIGGFLTEKDYKNYTIRVHALKSSARLIGAEALSADARHLEDLGNSLTDEDIKHIEELTPRLLEDYRRFLDLLSPLYAAEEAAREAAPEISAGELNEAYEAIKQFVESFDIDAIDGFIAEIRKYRIPRAEEAKFEAVAECVRNMDWNGLDEALRR